MATSAWGKLVEAVEEIKKSGGIKHVDMPAICPSCGLKFTFIAPMGSTVCERCASRKKNDTSRLAELEASRIGEVEVAVGRCSLRVDDLGAHVKNMHDSNAELFMQHEAEIYTADEKIKYLTFLVERLTHEMQALTNKPITCDCAVHKPLVATECTFDNCRSAHKKRKSN